MKGAGDALDACVATLVESPAFRAKRDIARLASRVDAGPRAVEGWRERPDRIWLGDDTAAVPDGAGYLLFAAEGMLPELVERDPYFAGWSSVMVNVSDVAAMGGAPLAVVDVLFHAPSSNVDAVLRGMRDACEAYGVPLVGGHTTCRERGPEALAVAILGRAQHLVTSFGARPGDAVLFAVDLRGRYHDAFPFWNATAGRDAEGLRGDLAVFGPLAAHGGITACKDVSNAGLAGSLLMLIESSGAGAVLDLDAVPRPDGAILDRWLLTFPSYGFVLTAPATRVAEIRRAFADRGLACERVGAIDGPRSLRLALHGEERVLWDLARRPFTGFGPPVPS